MTCPQILCLPASTLIILFPGIVFKFHMHVHNGLLQKTNLHSKGPSITFRRNLRNMLMLQKWWRQCLWRQFFIMWAAEINRYAIVYLHLCFRVCNTCSHSPYFHWDEDPSISPESNRGSFWIQTGFWLMLCTCI